MTEENTSFDGAFEELRELTDDLPPLPSLWDADMGELHASGAGPSQFYRTSGPSADPSPEGEWDRVGQAKDFGWGLKTPVGIVPFGPMTGNEVLDVLEDMTKGHTENDGVLTSEGGDD
jgi:hypothetical protein